MIQDSQTWESRVGRVEPFPVSVNLIPSSIDRSSRSRQIAEPGSSNCGTRVLQLRDPGLAEIPALGRGSLRVVNPFRLRLPFHRFSP